MDHETIPKCRTCLTENISQLLDWSLPIDLVSCGQVSYLECFRECTQLEANVDDLLPQTICQDCASQLQYAYFFIRRAKKANRKLMLLLKQGHNVVKTNGNAKLNPETFEWVTVQNIQTSPVEELLLPATSETKHNSPEHSASPKSDSLNTCERSKPLIKRKRFPVRKQCEYCDESLAKKDLKTHVARTHKPQILLCHVCPRTFKRTTNLREHAETHEENRVRNYTCEKCGHKFFKKWIYQNHVKTHDKDRLPVFGCDQCDKSFLHKGSLKVHMQQHMGKTQECKICLKKYVRAVDLAIHLRSHSGDRPFQCQYCEKSYAQRSVLNKHERYHEGHRYKCDICNKEYLHQTTLIAHRKEHTGLPFKCSICGKGFSRKYKIRRHIGGVHKVDLPGDIEDLIVRLETQREYRGRIRE